MKLAALADYQEKCSADGAIFQRRGDRGKHAGVKPILHIGYIRSIDFYRHQTIL